jgi:hypothetical protein
VESVNNHLKRQQIAGLPIVDDTIRTLLPLSATDIAAYLIMAEDEQTLMDAESGLLDDRLLVRFNAINQLYDQMRDIEWAAKSLG